MTPEQKQDLSQHLDEWIKAGMMDKDLKEVIEKKLDYYVQNRNINGRR